MKPYRRVDIQIGQMRLRGVAVADGSMQRLVGLGSRGSGAVLIRTRSVHTMTMPRPITVVAIGDDGRVIGVRLVPPRRLAWWRAAEAILEIDGSAPPISSGSVVRVLASRP